MPLTSGTASYQNVYKFVPERQGWTTDFELSVPSTYNSSCRRNDMQRVFHTLFQQSLLYRLQNNSPTTFHKSHNFTRIFYIVCSVHDRCSVIRLFQLKHCFNISLLQLYNVVIVLSDMFRSLLDHLQGLTILLRATYTAYFTEISCVCSS
jgi:hypothetical protein